MDHFRETNRFLADSNFFYTIAIGMDSRYTYVSDNYNRNFDLLGDSLLGKHFSVTLHPGDIPVCSEAGMRCFENPGKLIPVTLRKHNGEGGFVSTQWEMKALFNDNQEPEGIFCIGYNITELVSAKIEIESKSNQLTEIGFIQSHGVRRPLANILGLGELLTGTEVDPNVQHLHELLFHSARELDAVIKDITDKADH
ncbi:MAG: PAS domain-containing protein [Sphingobacteriales bacterium]